ncbi:hypothetical protein, partial [Archangium sp.]|uniref:hypothetical protein n=1 Tax=Archangium sp. TaxID=1872627 RepID=UPI002D223AB9
WQQNYRDILVKVRELSDEELARPENQELLWSADAIKAGQTDMEKSSVDPVERKPITIALWAYGKQFKGNFPVRRMVEAYRDVVQTTLAGISRSDLLEELGDKEEFKSLSLSSRRGLVRAKGTSSWRTMCPTSWSRGCSSESSPWPPSSAS